MGWDAFSSVKMIGGGTSKYRIKNLWHRWLFVRASKKVIKMTGSADCFLPHGGLDVSDCAMMLQKATGMDCWDGNGWSKKKVQELGKTANWHFKFKIEDAWAYWSARKAFELWVKLKLSIRFSY